MIIINNDDDNDGGNAQNSVEYFRHKKRILIFYSVCNYFAKLFEITKKKNCSSPKKKLFDVSI